MIHPEQKLAGSTQTKRTLQQGKISIALLGLGCFLVGVAAGIFFLSRAGRPSAESAASNQPLLSDGTQAVLQGLREPVELRFYSLLDPASTSDALRAYAARVGRLLAAYQEQAQGKVTLARHEALSDSEANAAAADGVRAFNLDKGDACFLGIAVVQKGRKETLAELSPNWESALESDLTRAIARVSTAPSPAQATPAAAPVESSVIREVKQKIPDSASLSFEDGQRLLREANLKEFQATSKALQAQLKAAEERFIQAQNSGSEADQQAARQQLLQLRKEQTEKLQQIAAQRQAQLAAWQLMKGVPVQPASPSSAASKPGSR